MTFQKTSLALLLALPLAATAADSPPPSELAGFILGISFLVTGKQNARINKNACLTRQTMIR